MPDTKSKITSWLALIPNLEGGRRFPGVPPDDAAKLFDEVLAGGKAGIVELIDSLQDVNDGQDWKTRFLLHGMASHTGSASRKADRAKLEAIYAGELVGDRSAPVKTFLVMQLQYFAGKGSVGPVAEQLRSDDPMLIAAAAATLTAIGPSASKAMKAMQGKVGERARGAIDHALMQIARNLA